MQSMDSNSQIEIIRLSREKRQLTNVPANTLIRDIRLFPNYNVPKSLQYLNRYCDIVLSRLRDKNFLCPNYHHLYIRIAETEDEALASLVITEDWHTWGIAILNAETLLKAEQHEQQNLVLEAIQNGLLDIAELDKLDKSKILGAISETREMGILSEISYKTKANNKITFKISTKIILGQNEEEIFFTIRNNATNKVAKWKFGQENISLINSWFGSISVTNKKITIKPKANMDLLLKGKQQIIELDVIKELSDPEKTGNNK